MYIKAVILISLLFVSGCKDSPHSDAEVDVEKNIAAANEFIDAFYSFNSGELESALEYAKNPNLPYCTIRDGQRVATMKLLIDTRA